MVKADDCKHWLFPIVIRHFMVRYQPLIVAVAVVAGFGAGGLWLLWRYTPDPSSDWGTDFTRSTVPIQEMISVGERDAMNPIDAPIWAPAQQVTWLGDKSPVIALHITEPARAYPLAVLIHHGVVNDMANEIAIAVTYCPLCNSPIVYNRRVNGEVLRFGTTGTLRNSGLVMWDHQTQSWWQQFSGVALVGSYSGTVLQVIPSQLVGYRQFVERFPDGVVLVGDESTPAMSYGRNPYIGYDSNPQPLMFVQQPDKRLPATERVLAGVINQTPYAYPFSVLSRRGVVNHIVEGWPVVAFWHDGTASALDRGKIDESRDVGSAALFNPMVDGQILTFTMRGTSIYDEQTNSQWNIFGEAISGTLRGAMLSQYNAQPYFWFAWAANYPTTHIYRDQ